MNILNRYDWVLLVFLIILSGCSAPEEPIEDDYVAKTDFPYMFRSSMYGTTVASSDKGYYFLNGNYLYFMDREGITPFLLDNRPDNDCFKEEIGVNCNAYVPKRHISQSILLQFYKDHLYIVESNYGGTGISGIYELVRRDPDGSNRIVLRTFTHGLMKEAAIHRGYLYYFVVDYDKMMRQTHQLLRLPLDKMSGEPEILYKKEHEDVEEFSVFEMFPYGSQIYLDEIMENNRRMLRYDLNDASVSTIWKRDDGAQSAIQAIQGQNIYFNYIYTKPDTLFDFYDKRSLIFYSSKLDGSNIQETDIPLIPHFPMLYMDDNFTYVQPMRVRGKDNKVVEEINIYKNGELLQKVDISMYPPAQGLTTGDERFMFLFFITNDQFNIHYLDKNEIESGNAKFKPLIETPSRP